MPKKRTRGQRAVQVRVTTDGRQTVYRFVRVENARNFIRDCIRRGIDWYVMPADVAQGITL